MNMETPNMLHKDMGDKWAGNLRQRFGLKIWQHWAAPPGHFFLKTNPNRYCKNLFGDKGDASLISFDLVSYSLQPGCTSQISSWESWSKISKCQAFWRYRIPAMPPLISLCSTWPSFCRVARWPMSHRLDISGSTSGSVPEDASPEQQHVTPSCETMPTCRVSPSLTCELQATGTRTSWSPLDSITASPAGKQVLGVKQCPCAAVGPDLRHQKNLTFDSPLLFAKDLSFNQRATHGAGPIQSEGWKTQKPQL